jgi:hypothetical protein
MTLTTRLGSTPRTFALGVKSYKRAILPPGALITFRQPKVEISAAISCRISRQDLN